MMIAQPDNHSTSSNPVGRFMVAVGAIIEHAETGLILIEQRASNLDWHPNEWEIGYGRIDQFEDPEDGLKREMQEELGLTDLIIGQVFSVWHIYRGPKKAENDLIGMTFYCQTHTSQIQLSDEHQAYQWVTPEEAIELIKIVGIQRDVDRFIQLKRDQKLKVGHDVIGIGAGALLLNDHNEVLLSLRGPLAKNERGKWEIPGGQIEFGETMEEGLKREVKEELGIEIEIVKMLEVYNHILPDEHQHWVSPTFICRIVEGEPTIMEPGKSDRVAWFSLDEAEKLPLSQVTAQDIKRLRTYLDDDETSS